MYEYVVELIARLREEGDEHSSVRVRAWTNANALTRVCAHRDVYLRAGRNERNFRPAQRA